VVIPVLAGHDRVGVLAVLLARPRDVTLSQVRLLETIAEIAGTAVQRIRLSDKIEDAFLDTALALARIVDERDSETNGHSDRLAEIALWLGSALYLSPQEQEDLRLAARLHDIGKSGVPDAILLKPDSLGPAEWSILKKHPAIGAEIIQPLQRLRGVAPLVLYHQERYDGTGYPEGLVGEAIPLGARILALADAVSAMLDGRIYRKARSWAEVRVELERCAGNQFDPRLVNLLLQHWPGLQVGQPG
jgi:HD-GYP domain-containing protein (c-di-GMP phosphodiesterase class II)